MYIKNTPFLTMLFLYQLSKNRTNLFFTDFLIYSKMYTDTNISRNITDETIQKFNYYCNIKPLEEKIDIEDNSKATFYLNNDKKKK